MLYLIQIRQKVKKNCLEKKTGKENNTEHIACFDTMKNSSIKFCCVINSYVFISICILYYVNFFAINFTNNKSLKEICGFTQ